MTSSSLPPNFATPTSSAGAIGTPMSTPASQLLPPGVSAPPLVSLSPQDVASFAALDMAMRAHPETAKEGEAILNPSNLAKLVDGIRRFQDDHLGRKSKNRYWPLLRIPDSVFRDRSRSGPLFTALLSAFRTKAQSIWRNFNFDNPKLFDDNVALLKSMEKDLIAAGFLRRPRIYFDETVNVGEGKDGAGSEREALIAIAKRFGASIVQDPAEIARGRVTHIVAYDPEEHDAPDVRQEEDRRAATGEEMERTYLRTLAVVEYEVAVDDDEGGEGTDAQAEEEGHGDRASKKKSKKKGSSKSKSKKPATPTKIPKKNRNQTLSGSEKDSVEVEDARVPTVERRQTALVHWWYWPASYDEWMPSSEVSGDVESDPPTGPPGGPAVVGCKFVRDAARYNEWGVESDYAIMEFERKVAFFREQAKAASNSKNSSKKRKKGSSSSKSKYSAPKEEPTKGVGEPASEEPTTASEPTTKKIKTSSAENNEVGEGGKSATSNDASVSAPGKDGVTPALPHTVGSGAKVPFGARRKELSSAPKRSASERRSGHGLNPRRIITGIYGPRGESVRRTVYDGALRVSADASGTVRGVLDDLYFGSGATAPSLDAKPEWRKRLPIIAVVRPTVDTALGTHIVVTELLMEESSPSSHPRNSLLSRKTLAVNRQVRIALPPSSTYDAGDRNTTGTDEPVRIRGGGSVELDKAKSHDVEMPEGSSRQDRLLDNAREMTKASYTEKPEAPQSTTTCEGQIKKQRDQSERSEINDSSLKRILEGTGGTLQESATAIGACEVAAGKVVATPGKLPTQGNAGEVAKNVLCRSEKTALMFGISLAAVDASGRDEQAQHGKLINSYMKPNSVATSAGSSNGGANDANRSCKESSCFSGKAAPSFKTKIVQTAQQVTKDNLVSASVVQIDGRDEIHKKKSARVDGPKDSHCEVSGKHFDLGQRSSKSRGLEESAKLNAKTTDTVAPSAAISKAAVPMHAQDSIERLKSSEVKAKSMVPDRQKQSETSSLKEPCKLTNDNVKRAGGIESNERCTNRAGDRKESVQSINTVRTNPTSLNNKSDVSKMSNVGAISAPQVLPLIGKQHLSNSLTQCASAATAAACDEEISDLPPWYKQDEVSEFEKRMLPEWFNISAPHRTTLSYLDTREKVINIAKDSDNQFITATAIRRIVVGDAGSLLRLHKFLTTWGLINNALIGESTPADPALLRRGNGTKRTHSAITTVFWTADRIKTLEASVIRHASKQHTYGGSNFCDSMIDDSNHDISLNWETIALEFGDRVSAADCQRAFLKLPSDGFQAARNGTASDMSASSLLLQNELVFSEILASVRPEVLKATVDASLKATQDMAEARKASVVVAVASVAADRSEIEDDEVAKTLMDIVDQRVQRLENRIALLDDVEGLMEAERVALELERRDLYTARCRHWFGDGSA